MTTGAGLASDQVTCVCQGMALPDLRDGTNAGRQFGESDLRLGRRPVGEEVCCKHALDFTQSGSPRRDG